MKHKDAEDYVILNNILNSVSPCGPPKATLASVITYLYMELDRESPCLLFRYVESLLGLLTFVTGASELNALKTADER